jgi:hypothetical protein
MKRTAALQALDETPLTSVFAQGRFCGTILSRGRWGFEAIGEDDISHGCFSSQRDAAAVLVLRSAASPKEKAAPD